MQRPKVSVVRITAAWFVLLWLAGWALPPIDSHAPVHPAVKAVLAVSVTLLLVLTPIALYKYFDSAWHKAASVPNKTAYAIWVGLETATAVTIASALFYMVVVQVISHFR